MRAGGEISWARLRVCHKGGKQHFDFLWSWHQDLARVCQTLEALLLTTLTAKTYTTQHDGEFLGFSLYYYPSLVGTFNILLRRVSDCVQQASHDGR